MSEPADGQPPSSAPGAGAVVTARGPSKRLPLSAYVYGVLGAYVLSLFLPCLLLYWRAQGKFLGEGPPWSPVAFGLLILTAVILCTPGTTVLALIVTVILRRKPQPEAEAERKPLLGLGASIGAGMAVLNFPAYLGVLHIHGDWPRMVGVVLVGGATAGAWIGYQVFRGYHRQYPFFPRWSLQTLMLIVITLGLLMWLYMPEKL
jgi:uncharacterized membrane protein YsdA (DUF1294 family)